MRTSIKEIKWGIPKVIFPALSIIAVESPERNTNKIINFIGTANICLCFNRIFNMFNVSSFFCSLTEIVEVSMVGSIFSENVSYLYI